MAQGKLIPGLFALAFIVSAVPNERIGGTAGFVVVAAAAEGNACGHTLGAAIFAKWQQLGGERGVLGCPTMREAEAGRSPQGTSGRYVTFRGGGMTVTTSGARAGQAFEYHGLIYQVYAQLGGSVSWLGFPVSDEYDVPGGRRSDFEGGYIFWDRATNQARAERPGAPVAAACDASGTWQAATDGIGAATWTFAPAGPSRYAAREQGLGNATGTAIVSGSRLRVDWTTGGYAGHYEWDLGAGCAGGAGTLVFTQGGSSRHGSRIARGTAAAAAPPQQPPAQAGNACGHTLGGGIFAKWQQLGGERGLLGCPTRSEGGALGSPQGSTGTWADFQHGLITWTVTGPRANQAFEVHGVIKNLYMQMGGSGSWLGFPISDEYDVGGGRRSDFEGGYIFWDRATNQARAERSVAGQAGGRPPVVTEGHVPPPPAGRSYPKPQMAGAIVDWCATWATNCGQGGADQFCRMQGHERAADFHTFTPGRTYVIGSRQICEGSHCTGFLQVTCAGPGPAPVAGTPLQPAARELSGSWYASTRRLGSITWTFQPLGGNRYSAVERGPGDARGTATLVGNRLRVDWTAAGGAWGGYYEWDLGPELTHGTGRLVLTRGGSGTHPSSIRLR